MNWSLEPESAIQVLISAAWESALLVLIIYFLLWGIGRWISPSWRVALWTIPLLRLVVLVLPVISFRLLPAINGEFLHPAGMHPSPPTRATHTFYQSISPLFQRSQQTGTQLSTTPTMTQTRALRARFFQLAFVVWIGGIVFFASRWLLTSISLRRILCKGEEVHDAELRTLVEKSFRQANLARRVRCIVTDEEVGPATYGLVRPKIILPKRMVSELTPGELEMVIAHELEHVKRYDILLVTIGRIAVAMHWYNPLAYFVRRTLQQEMELAVDAATIGNIGSKRIGDYGDLLVRLVQHPSTSLSAAQMASPGKSLHHRVKKLVGWRRAHWSHQVLGAVATCLVALFGLCKYDSSTAAQEIGDSQPTTAPTSPPTGVIAGNQSGRIEVEPADEDEADLHRVSGRVLDSVGNPVPNAQLFREFYAEDKSVRRVSEIANQDGEFSITYSTQGLALKTYQTWVYAEGHGVRVVNVNRSLVEEKAVDLEIRLPPLESEELKVLMPDGTPCVDAVVTPSHIDVPNGVFEADEPTGLSDLLPEQLQPLLSRKTDRQGRVRIEGIPLALLDSIEVKSRSYGRQHFRRTSGGFNEPLRLKEVGRIYGSLQLQSPQQFSGTKVFVSTGHSATHEGLAETELDENGRFQIPAIASGPLQIDFDWRATEVHPFVSSHPTVLPGETLDLEIDVRPTIPVTGTILTADTREPVGGARISLRYPNQGPLRIPNVVETDDQGRYSTRLATGAVSRQVFAGITSPFEYPRLEPVVIPADAKAYVLPEISIHRMRLVRGKLVDDSGEPVSGATVVLHTGSYRHVAGEGKTNREGSFQMRVRNWEYYSTTWQDRWYWATLDQPALRADPPSYTRLTMLNQDPDGLLLRRP